jgi:hypothetical protein
VRFSHPTHFPRFCSITERRKRLSFPIGLFKWRSRGTTPDTSLVTPGEACLCSFKAAGIDRVPGQFTVSLSVYFFHTNRELGVEVSSVDGVHYCILVPSEESVIGGGRGYFCANGRPSLPSLLNCPFFIRTAAEVHIPSFASLTGSPAYTAAS